MKYAKVATNRGRLSTQTESRPTRALLGRAGSEAPADLIFPGKEDGNWEACSGEEVVEGSVTKHSLL